MSEHKGLKSYISPNAGTVDAASGNVGKPSVEQTVEGAPRRPVVSAPAVPIVDGKPLGADAVPQTSLGLFASTMMKDLEGKK